MRSPLLLLPRVGSHARNGRRLVLPLLLLRTRLFALMMPLMRLVPPLLLLVSPAVMMMMKIQGTFLKMDDPKISALMQQAELLSSLALKNDSENMDQSLESAWKEQRVSIKG